MIKSALPCALLTALTLSIFPGCAGDSEQARSSTSSHRERDDDAESTPLATRVAKLRLGMSKSQVVAIMGEDGRTVSQSQTEHGTIETMHYMPGFGSRYVSALKSSYSFGLAGHSGLSGATLMIKNGRLSNISSY